MLRTTLLAALLSAAAFAQDARELSVPVAHVQLLGVTSTSINTQIANGFRLVDIDYRGSGLLGTTYDALFVQNTGSYSTGWWWYTGVTATQVGSYLSSNQARLIDLEPYEDGNGNLRFACIMVDNTGANSKAWWWYYNTSSSALATATTTNNARLVDVDTYEIGSTTYYSGVMISNTGNDSRPWWHYYNLTPTQISSYLNTNNARLYDLEKRPNGNWDCVMIRDASIPAWYWWYGLTSSDVAFLVGNFGVRIIDVESYLDNGSRRYAIVTINNSNALTTTVGNAMRGATDGAVGCWFERINGGNLANLQGDFVFEPASTMKTLHHVHAMRRVYVTSLALSQLITQYQNYSPTNASCPVDSNPVQRQLQSVLRDMMESSDNRSTQAIRAYFGESNINNTAAALGMASTQLRHRLGCGADALANPNQITLRDLHSLHEQVANGYLGTNFRETFYDLMLDSVNDLSVATIINQEGASLNLPSTTIASFRNFTRLAHKGGNYSLSSGGPQFYHRAEFGYLSLPFISNDVITPREYSFGAFVNDASNDSNAIAAIYTHALPGLLRPTIRQALQSWNNSLAGVVSFGSGCGTFNPHTQLALGLPRIGATVTYSTSNGYANSLEVLGFGFNTSVWNGVPLPASLTPFGSASGCNAYVALAINEVGFSNASGNASFGVTIPNNTVFIGFEYATQGYTFNASGLFRTSNALRSIVGL